MKKYLMTGVAALAFAATFTSCSKAGDLYDEGAVNQQKEQALIDSYEKAFEAAFGPVGSNVAWGFSSKAGSRAGAGEIVKPDMTTFPGHTTEREHQGNYRTPDGYADIVAPVTTKEAAWVMDWFSKNPGLSEQGVDFHNFFVQNVGNNGHTKAGYFHSTEGGKPETVEAKTYEGIQMDQLLLGPVADANNMIHGLDFNATNGFNEWNLFYVKGGSALQFAYYASRSSEWQYKFKCVKLTVPAECFEDNQPHTGWYVGFSYYALHQETQEKWHEIGIDRLQYADDWVLKIVPGEGELPYRVIAEDLTAAQSGDFDFNDVVFDVVGNDGANTTLKLMACGGTLPLKIGSTNGEGGVEVHSLFGQNEPNANGKYDMFNTGAGKTHEPVEFTVSGVYDTPEKLNNLRIEVEKEDRWVLLTATRGKAACKVLVDSSFPIVPERHGIASENENFTKYVAGDFVDNFWWKRR